jgi:hypothetical protein
MDFNCPSSANEENLGVFPRKRGKIKAVIHYPLEPVARLCRPPGHAGQIDNATPVAHGNGHRLGPFVREPGQGDANELAVFCGAGSKCEGGLLSLAGRRARVNEVGAVRQAIRIPGCFRKRPKMRR